ncbi:bifunctional riboflavin kinase/FAD synthetase [Lichenibacterium dinghuense]|uniref:bifunctional riboflavin kinase/FAD synthetase n=1 Tax=Lichenibacterium dinghuense TaxID=2895977 RepID=UPI001EFFC967|nr:bifunctional riboflavin kinase/FAD synthetase [Lichenibacterium sp. 6Y81]
MIAPLPPRFIVAEDPDGPPAGLEGAVVAIGNFDGVHRGHQAVIGRARALAAELGRPTAVLTFEPHPGDYFAGAPTIFRITPPAAKALALSRLGTVDGMVVRSFDAGFASLSAEDFVADVLVRRLGIAAAVVGYDFHFGARRAGTPAYLADAGVRHGFAVAVIDKIVSDAMGDLAAVSSTAIRRALEAGDVARAATLLGRPYFVLGEVVHGEKLGRTLGFPTANLRLDPTARLAHGIYAVRVRTEAGEYGGVASYGRRPTFDNGAPLLESFLFDFSGDLYGQHIEVDFVGWIRGEERFDSAEALVMRMKVDAAEARAMLAG